MSVPLILLAVLFLLMAAIGGVAGIKSFITLIFNFVTLMLLFICIALGFNPVSATVAGCVIISSVTLFYISGLNRKTISSWLSILAVVLVTLFVSCGAGIGANIQGFTDLQAESIQYLSLYVHLDFSQIVICEILLGLLGAVIDVSISISSSMNEILKLNPGISKHALLTSGVRIGKDILGTMTNTLLFAYIGGFMSVIIWLKIVNMSLSSMINQKAICSDVFQLLSSGIGIILIIPVTAVAACLILTFRFPFSHGKKKSA